MEDHEIVIHTDGGSRGNPGPASCAFVIDQNDVEVFKGSKYLGLQTNNFAEYSGVILALEWLFAQKLIISNYSLITFFLDSELVVKQINGLYKVKDENLKILFNKVLDMLRQINVKVVFKNVRRHDNSRADFLVNQKLDIGH